MMITRLCAHNMHQTVVRSSSRLLDSVACASHINITSSQSFSNCCRLYRSATNNNNNNTITTHDRDLVHTSTPATKAIHVGEAVDPLTGASVPPVHLSSTFAVSEPLSFSANELRESDPYCYGRWANPTVRSLEHKLAALEGVEEGNAVAFGSGMCASAALMFSLLKSGDHVVTSNAQYPGVAELMRYTLPRFDIETTPVDVSNLESIEAALRPGKTKIIWIETPCNPILRLADISACAKLAHSVGAELVVDSTFATPIITKPIADHGADFVIHSLTKYLCGHGDAIGGAVVGKNPDRIQRIRTEGAIHHGGVLSPFNAYLISRGISTLPLRMERHSSSATIIANWLETQPGIERVLFPYLESHPQHDLAKSQMAMAGGMLSFRVAGGMAVAEKLASTMMKQLQIVHYAVSLGHHRSLVYLLSTDDLAEREGSSYALEERQLESYRELAGDGLFRLSVGLEDPDDLKRDLANVFKSVLG